MHTSFWYLGEKTKYASFYEAVMLDVFEFAGSIEWMDAH